MNNRDKIIQDYIAKHGIDPNQYRGSSRYRMNQAIEKTDAYQRTRKYQNEWLENEAKAKKRDADKLLKTIQKFRKENSYDPETERLSNLLDKYRDFYGTNVNSPVTKGDLEAFAKGQKKYPQYFGGEVKEPKKEESKKDDESPLNKFMDFVNGLKDRGDRTVAKAVNSAGFNVLDNVADMLPDNKLGDALRNVKLGPMGTSVSLADIQKAEEEKSNSFGGKALDVIGEGAGYLVPGTGAYKLVKGVGKLAQGTKAADKLSKLPKVLQRGLEGAGASTLFAGADAGLTEAIAPEERNLSDHLKRAGVEVGLGAVGDAVAPILLKQGSRLFHFFRKEEVSPQEIIDALDNPSTPQVVKDEILLLNEGQKLLPEPQPTKKPNFTPADEININGTPLLEAPKTQTAIPFNRTNEYAQKFTRLVEEANKIDMFPGREREIVEDLWNRMKDYNDPSLDELIRLATPSLLKQNPSPNLIHQARQNQSKSAYGLDTLFNRLKKVNEPVPYPKQEGTPLSFKQEKYVVNKEQAPLNYTGQLEQPLVSTKVQKRDNFNDFDSLSMGDKIRIKQGRGEKEVEFVTKSGDSVVIRNSKGREVVIPASDVVGSAKPLQKLVETLNPNKKVAPKEQYENISRAPIGKSLKKVTEPVNKFDYPYKQGDPLPDTTSQLTTKTKKGKFDINREVTNAYTKSIDDLYRLNQLDEYVQNQTGKPLTESEKSYMLALNSRGSDMISKYIATDKMVDMKGNEIGKSLKDITQNIPKGKVTEFEDYLVNKHAITRMERGEKVFEDALEMSPEKAKAKVEQYENINPKFAELAKDFYNFRKQLGEKWLVDTGVLSKSEWEGYLKSNPNYVPNKRYFDELEMPMFNGARKGYANQTNPVKKAVGSQRKIISPIESTIEDIATYVKTAKRNEVMQTLIKNIQKNPEAFEGWAEIVPTDKAPEAFMDSLGGTLEKDGVEGLLEKFNEAFDQKPDLTKGNIVTGFVDGKRVHVKVNDPQLLQALTNINPNGRSVIIQAIGQATRAMKTLTTGVNPIFSLTRNVFRDIPTAYGFSKTTKNPITFSKDLLDAIVQVAGDKELYKSFKRIGGGHSSPISSDVNMLAQSKRAILPQKGVKARTGQLIGFLENLNNAVEAAPRLAEYKRIRKQGDYDSQVRALFEANDITVNFNKRGSVAKEADAIVPYLNAALQGYDKLVRTYFNTKDPKFAAQVWAKTVAAITLPSIALYAINHDNKNYQQLSDYLKDGYYLIPTGDTFIKIPKPRETGVIFGAGVERLLRQWKDDDPKAFKDFAETMKNTFSLPMRTIAHPVLRDLPANKNFADIPIVPGDLERLSPENQYDSRTSEPAKVIGKVLNKSPKQIDYLASSYGGILSDIGIPLTTKDVGLGETLKRQVTADPVFSNDLLNDFYETKSKLDTAYSDFKATGEKPKDLNEALRKLFGNTSRDISEIRKQQKQIQKDTSLASDERQEKLRKLQQMINNLARRANERAN